MCVYVYVYVCMCVCVCVCVCISDVGRRLLCASKSRTHLAVAVCLDWPRRQGGYAVPWSLLSLPNSGHPLLVERGNARAGKGHTRGKRGNLMLDSKRILHRCNVHLELHMTDM